MKKYMAYFRAMITSHLEYRGALLIWMLIELISVGASVFIWLGIFSSSDQVGTFHVTDIISYYFFLPIIGAFTSASVTDTLPREIRLGSISAEIVKPYNFSYFRLAHCLGSKITQLSLKIPVYLFIGFFLWAFIQAKLNWAMLPFALIFVCLGFLMHFYFDYGLSLLAFWVEDVWSFGLLKRILLLVFGGLAFPLSLVPKSFAWIFDVLPFKFIYYFPIAILQNNISQKEILFSLPQILFWLMFFYIISRLLWSKGLSKYGAYGQ